MCYHGTLVSLIFLKKKMKMKRKERVEKDKRQSRWAERHPYLTRLKREEQKTVPLNNRNFFQIY